MESEGKSGHSFSLLVCLNITYVLIFVLNCTLANAQGAEHEFFYYSSGRKIELPVSLENLVVRFREGVTLQQQKATVESEPNLGLFFEREEVSIFNLILLPLRKGLAEENVVKTINSLNNKSEVEFACPVFHFPDAELTLTDEFIVKFETSVSEAEIKAFNATHNVEIAREPEWPGRYILRVKDATNLNTLKTANLYSENPITIYSVPNFIRRLKEMVVTPDDTYFQGQWGLNNNGQTGGTVDADMDAPEGWQITTGSSEIVIAVIDSGVDPIHEDLITKIVDGYDYIDYDNDPSPLDDDPHGTCCAGLASSVTNNQKGVAGVSWNCKIMPVRMFERNWTNDQKCAAAIRWATDNGADVLSNSWGGGPYSVDIHEAIKYAKNNGRDGKGCVILFASGNDNNDVSYPAKYDEVIAVGATDHNDKRWDLGCIGRGCGSNYGPELNVVAPSAWGSTYGVPLWTTDISGRGGYNPGNTLIGDAAGNYYKWFGGTSGATPQVAGLAGLVLSVNPDLDSDEVQSIIQSTADDVNDSGGRDDEYGWGRINIYNAVLEAVPSKGHIDLDKDYYNCDCNVGIFLADYDLKGANDVNVTIACANDLETVTLNETEPNTGVFTGTISAASGDPNSGDDVLQVYHDEIITATYEDVNDGTGNPASPNDTSVVDCVCPVIYDVNFEENPIGPDDITIIFDTNEFSYTRVLYGESCGDPNKTSTLSLGYSHTVKLKRVTPWVDCYFIVKAVDPAGNETVDSNNGNCYRFTPDGPIDINVPGDFNTIQEAIDQPIWDGSRVIVAEGTYNEEIDFKGKGITVTSTDPNDWDVVGNTIIYYEPSPEEGFVVFNSGEDSNSILAGFTAKGSGSLSVSIDIQLSSNPTVTNCIITDTSYGIICEDSSPVIKNNKIFGIPEYGIACTGDGAPVIENNWIYDSIYEGGSGIGIYFAYVSSTGIVQNNTIFNNEVGIRVDGGVVPEISNCIVWDNGDDLYNCNATYSCIEDPNDANGVGNITDDPNFVDADANDFHLEPNSPCFNVGDPNGDYSGETDIDGDERVMDGRVDMGADEIDCLFVDANEYDDWVAWGKPECWCYERQCRGDTNGEEFFGICVSLADKEKLDEAFNKTDAELREIEDGICADLNHTSFFGKRVTLSDLNILKDYFNETEPNVPPCDESPVITGPYNFWTN